MWVVSFFDEIAVFGYLVPRSAAGSIAYCRTVLASLFWDGKLINSSQLQPFLMGLKVAY
jgi:hypothetical protein